MFRRLALACAALLSVVSAQLTITSPGTNDWWVAVVSKHVVVDVHDFPVLELHRSVLSPTRISQFSLHPLPSLLFKKTMTVPKPSPSSNPPKPLAPVTPFCSPNTLNSTDIWAQSQPFEIKALGSSYPTTTSSAGSASTGTASGTAGAAQSTHTGGTLAKYVPVGMSMVAALALGLVVA
ncbi:hypothetical protein EDD22DRAFT_509720 [Suillus occidentalis]|nr:hypothetical protein EDD22DRAFT_509720 [Suillus occidentalis]